jgi:hypothetical protein
MTENLRKVPTESAAKNGGYVHNMMHRNSITLRWVAYEEYVFKPEGDESDDENRANAISESTETDNKKTDENENSAENTEDDVSESAEFEDEGTMKRQINKSEKAVKIFSHLFHEHQLMQRVKKRRKLRRKKKKMKNFHRLMSQKKLTFGM